MSSLLVCAISIRSQEHLGIPTLFISRRDTPQLFQFSKSPHLISNSTINSIRANDNNPAVLRSIGTIYDGPGAFIGNALDSFPDEDFIFIFFLDSVIERFKDSAAAKNPRKVSRPRGQVVIIRSYLTFIHPYLPLPNKQRVITLIHKLPFDVTKDEAPIRY